MSAEVQPTADDRLLAAVRSIIRAEFPRLVFMGLYEYSVAHATGTPPEAITVDCSPVDPAIGLPELTGVPLNPGTVGDSSSPTSGSRVLVAFINADPSRPIVIGGDPANPPSAISLAGGTMGVARLGDTVLVGGNSGVITSASTKVRAG